MEMSIFATRLAAGLTWAVMASDRRAVAPGYFRSCLLVALGLVALACIAGWSELDAWQCGLLIISTVACYLAQAAWGMERSAAGTAVQAVAGIALLGAVLGDSSLRLVDAADAVAASLLLGTSLAAMLLGHYYLTAPWMSPDPLYRLLTGILTAGAARGVTAWLASAAPASSLSSTNAELGSGLFLGLRWLVGIAGPIVLGLMAWRTLQHKHTQAATGLLYVVVICVLLGETTALMLDRSTAGAVL
jgi:hypothetical protein